MREQLPPFFSVEIKEQSVMLASYQQRKSVKIKRTSRAMSSLIKAHFIFGGTNAQTAHENGLLKSLNDQELQTNGKSPIRNVSSPVHRYRWRSSPSRSPALCFSGPVYRCVTKPVKISRIQS